MTVWLGWLGGRLKADDRAIGSWSRRVTVGSCFKQLERPMSLKQSRCIALSVVGSQLMSTVFPRQFEASSSFAPLGWFHSAKQNFNLVGDTSVLLRVMRQVQRAELIFSRPTFIR